jgi:hypothetical protein
MSEVAELEFQLQQIKGLQHRREQAERLSKNADFRDLIITGFCRDDAARFAQESGDPTLNAEQRADALGMAQASGHLKRYLMMQIKMGETAERNILDIEEALTEARLEEEGAN